VVSGTVAYDSAIQGLWHGLGQGQLASVGEVHICHWLFKVASGCVVRRVLSGCVVGCQMSGVLRGHLCIWRVSLRKLVGAALFAAGPQVF